MARGRPTRQDEASTAKVGVRLTSYEREELQRVARENRQSVAAVVRDAVNEYVADYRERGVFGGRNSSGR
jgi:hypothetical protein